MLTVSTQRVRVSDLAPHEQFCVYACLKCQEIFKEARPVFGANKDSFVSFPSEQPWIEHIATATQKRSPENNHLKTIRDQEHK
jgi:hypothetical protein